MSKKTKQEWTTALPKTIVDRHEDETKNTVTAQLGDFGSGDAVLKKIAQEAAENMGVTWQQKHEAAVLSAFAAMARLGSLEVQRAQSLVLTTDQMSEYERLKQWWNWLGEENQKKLAMKAHELCYMVFDLTQYL